MPDEGRKDGEEEADAARGPHPGHARAAAGDRSVHSRHRSLQVEQAEVRGRKMELLFPGSSQLWWTHIILVIKKRIMSDCIYLSAEVYCRIGDFSLHRTAFYYRRCLWDNADDELKEATSVLTPRPPSGRTESCRCNSPRDINVCWRCSSLHAVALLKKKMENQSRCASWYSSQVRTSKQNAKQTTSI